MKWSREYSEVTAELMTTCVSVTMAAADVTALLVRMRKLKALARWRG